MADAEFWERPDIVARFADRDPDHRLVALAGRRDVQGLRALDVGCAAGRNSRFLAERGADVWALDGSSAMVEATRSALAAVLGRPDADRRVIHGRMDVLDAFADGAFDLVLLLGVLQNAASDAELERTLDEVRRVLAAAGHCLVANFAPDSRPSGVPVSRVAGERHVYTDFGGPHRRIALLTPAALDAAFGRRGLAPEIPTATVRIATQRGHRTTVNALYRLVDA